MSLRSTYDQAAYEAERFGPPFQHPLGKPYPEQVEAIERSSRRNAEIAAGIAAGKAVDEVERLCRARAEFPVHPPKQQQTRAA